MRSVDEGAGEPSREAALDQDSVADRLLEVTVWLAVIAAAVVTLGSIVNHFVLDQAVRDLDAGEEDSLNNWATVVASFAGGLAAALHGAIFPERRRWFFAIAAILAFLSLDDLIALHERVANNIDIEHVETALFAPVYAAALLMLWGLSREVPARAGRYLRIGLLLLVAAIVVDFGATFTIDLRQEGTEWPHFTRIAIEEGLEVSGWILVSATLITLVCVALLDAGRSPRPESSPPR